MGAATVGFLSGPWDARHADVQLDDTGLPPATIEMATLASVERLQTASDERVEIARVTYRLTKTAWAPQLGVHFVYVFAGERTWS